MSRLDQHISFVRTKLTLRLFVTALAWLALGLAIIVWLVILLEHLLGRRIAHHGLLLIFGASIDLAMAIFYCLWRRPTATMTAIEIDRQLDLNEKFSTALYVRPSKDPFSVAAVRDAEYAAGNVSMNRQFPVDIPRQFLATAVIVLAAFLTAMFLPMRVLQADIKPKPPGEANEAPDPKTPKFTIQQLGKIEQAVDNLHNNDAAIKRAMDELKHATRTDEGDINHQHRSALQALESLHKTIVDETSRNERIQTAYEQKKQLEQMSDAADPKTPMGKAQNEIKNGDLDNAMKDIAKGVQDFDKKSPEEKKKLAEEAQQLAAAIKQAANNPAVANQLQQQMQQMGATQQQAQQMMSAMQQAAQGSQQGAQQAQQLAKQIQAQMNHGQGPTAQQSQQISKMMANMQGMMSSQGQAQALSQSAAQMAQAMQQAAQASNQQQGTAGQKTTTGAPGQQGSSKPGNQPGQGKQQMQAASQQMQATLQQMQAAAKDAQQMQAAAQAAAQAAQQQQQQLSQGGGQNPAGGNSPGSGQGQGKGSGAQGNSGQGQGQGQGQGGQGQGQGQGGQGGNGPGGSQMGIAEAPYATVPQMDQGDSSKGGKVLAGSLVKAGIDPGESHASLRDVAASAQKQEPDEVEQDHISRDAQQAVKDYFSTLQNTDGN